MKDYELIFNAVTKVTGVSKSKMLSRSRLWPVVEARRLFVLFYTSGCGYDDQSAAWLLNRCRTTVLKIRHSALDYFSVSTSFKGKYSKITEIYEHSKESV